MALFSIVETNTKKFIELKLKAALVCVLSYIFGWVITREIERYKGPFI